MGVMYEEEELPWEEDRAIRRDCEPHRAKLVSNLGVAGLLFGVVSFCGGATGLLGLPLGLTALVMAHRDLAKIRAGTMDRRGEKRTRRGGDAGLVGALLSLVGAAAWAALVVDRFLPPPYGSGLGW